jgi:hypothetical protein
VTGGLGAHPLSFPYPTLAALAAPVAAAASWVAAAAPWPPGFPPSPLPPDEDELLLDDEDDDEELEELLGEPDGVPVGLPVGSPVGESVGLCVAVSVGVSVAESVGDWEVVEDDDLEEDEPLDVDPFETPTFARGGKSSSSTPWRAAFTKAVQMRTGYVPPVTSPEPMDNFSWVLPSGLVWNSATEAARLGVNPANHAEKLPFVVPVLPAAGRPRRRPA